MAIIVIRKCLCCGNDYESKSAKAFLCGKRMCYVNFHKKRQALRLDIKEYKQQRKLELEDEENTKHST